VRTLPLAIALAASLLAPSARADRIAILPLEAGGRPAPVVEGEQLGADLIAHGHRVLAAPDVLARVSAGDAVGADWAARLVDSIETARSALTRLDRRFATGVARDARDQLVRHGGGAGGPEALVEWCLLERQVALTGGDAKEAARWLDAAAVFGASVELDPVRHPEDERDLFARRRRQVHAEAPAKLSLTTTPPGADVWIDGVRRCASPCSVSLVPGRHLALLTAAAHAPATLDVDLAAGTETSRQLGLSAAYAGASPRAVASMLADPSRRAEGASALEPMARFLDVQHVVAVVPAGQGVRVIVSPPATGRSRIGPEVPAKELSPAVMEQLRPTELASNAAGAAPAGPWYAKPGTWLAGAGIVLAVVGGVIIYDASRPAKTGIVTVTSP
jgi:PEGA domain